ncbi:phage major capsid protein [Lentibacillus amyloliquefaciens]|uniref:Capsid protein n=1 Tax=Lentibacillus amyloliquefaciens TaxID=1472767 RepID=A0A0U4FP68_9BACI|nr:phage major capsid protein [Lentibacillus amyloliquefaciens]ALX50462.1 capsid protein [Lentibacillus amyloliquefaciens]
MSNPVILGAKLNMRRESLRTIDETIQQLKEKRDELYESVESAETDEDLQAIEGEADDNDKEIETQESEKQKLEDEIAELENKIEELNQKSPDKQERKDERHMSNEKLEVREAINHYVKTKGQTRDGFTSVEGGALIPEELLSPQKAPEDVVDLSNLVRRVPVNSGSGKYPVIKKSGSKMNSVTELANNPELAKPNISEVPYDVETYRGYIPVSQEVIDDADYDVTQLIADEISDQELNTKNAAIATVLKAATAKAVTGIDGLKSVFNKDIKKVYNAKAIISSSLYNSLDTEKDANGRYLLQDDITVASGKRLFGKEVVVLDDDMIGGADGDMVGFIGDPKAAVALFDRKRASVKWVDNDVYGQLLAGFVRFDVEETDSEAGFYVTYTEATSA